MREMNGYDVVVVGGGPGGLCAAVAAGRSGARTLLIEREGCLGGGATTMLVHPFMPHRTHEEVPRDVNAGLFAEIVRRLVDRSAAEMGGCIRFNDEALKVVLDELAAEAGVDVLFHAALYDAQIADGRVTAVTLAHNGGPIRATGTVFIDGTGDGLLAERAGCEIQIGDDDGNVMPMTLNFAVGGADQERAEGVNLRKLCAAGADDEPALINTHYSCSTWMPNGLCQFNKVRIPGDTLDPTDLSRAEAEGRRRVENFVAWLKANVPGFENCTLVKTGQHIGIRESRRVIGDHVLTLGEFQAAAKFDDAIACCSYAVDKHNQAAGDTLFHYLPSGEYYQVPYGCLTPKGLSNLLIASRGISVDVYVHASVRIMPTVMSLGEAAGLAAAMALPEGDVRAIDVQTLRTKIRDAGGVLEP